VNILIIEDDAKTARAIRQGLTSEGYTVTVALSGEDGFAQASHGAFDLILLDWMLPGRDGIEILKLIRSRGPNPPVLMLTARDGIDDRVLGLNGGADDYLVKPFAFAELLARIRVLLRRAEQDTRLHRKVGDLSLDMQSRRIWRVGEEITLTPREFDLLVYFIRFEGQVVTRQMLAQEVWRESNRSTPIDNVIDVHVARLRKKVDEGHPVRLIQTIRGVGFLFGEKSQATPQ
jgi:DNA-binding response OmpR family regulator